MTDDVKNVMEGFANTEAAKAKGEVEEKLRSMKEILDEHRVKSREAMYERLRKWLYLPDTNRVDLILSVYISTFDEGKPLWVFIVGGSGDCKSELLNTLDGRPNVRKVDQLSANTLASGKTRHKKNDNGESKEYAVKDLGGELEGKKTLLMFTDLACLTSLNKDEKKKIWSQFRTLYDGEIFKDTGSGVQKKYTDCHVNIVAAVTSAIKDEYAVHQQLGTRELLYDTEPDPRDNKEKMNWSLKHSGKEREMKQDLKSAVDGFLLDKKYNPSLEMPQHILNYLYLQCEQLRILRATGKVDWRTGEADGDYEAEVTTRLIQQLSKLYRALHSLDPEYPDENFFAIVERIVRSSSDPIRYKLYHFFPQSLGQSFTAYDLHLLFKNSRMAISAQCEALWNLGLIEKSMDVEQIGGACVRDDNGNEYRRGGRWDKVAKYTCREDYRRTTLEDFFNA